MAFRRKTHTVTRITKRTNGHKSTGQEGLPPAR